MKTKFLSIALGTLLLALAGCSGADTAKVTAWGQTHIIKQYSGGVLIGQWESTGKVENEDHSDGYFFKNDKTGTLVTVSGDVQITVK